MSESEGSTAAGAAELVRLAGFFVKAARVFLAAAFLAAGLAPDARFAGFFVSAAVTSVPAVSVVAASPGERDFEARVCSDLEVFGTVIGKIPVTDARPRDPLQVDSANHLPAARIIAYPPCVRHFVFRWLVTTVAVMVASSLVPGIRYDGLGSLLGAALLLGILNAFVRPVLLLLSAPLILLSLGIFILVVNGLMLRVVPSFVPGFHVETFGSAFWGAMVVGVISWVLSAFFRGSDGRVHVLTHHTQVKRVQGRVIDSQEKQDS